MTSGELFKTLRVISGQTITGMARDLGVSYRTYRGYEMGRLTLRQAVRLCKAQGIQVEEFAVVHFGSTELKVEVNDNPHTPDTHPGSE